MLTAEAGHDFGKVVDGDHRAGADGEATAFELTDLLDQGLERGSLDRDPLRLLVEEASFGGEAYLATVALHQGQADDPLELCHQPGGGRLGDLQLARRRAVAAVRDDIAEDLELPEGEGEAFPAYLCHVPATSSAPVRDQSS